MNKMVSRIAAGVVLMAAVLGITFWQVSKNTVSYVPLETDSPVVMTINGDEVTAEEFATYMVYNMKYYENMYAQYGISDLWSNDSASVLGEMMPGFAQDQAVYTRVVLEKFEEAGLKLSYTQQKEISSMREQMIEQAGGYDEYLTAIGQLGFDDQSYTNFMYVTTCYSALNEYYFGENGVNAPTAEQLTEYFKENYLAAKHILILTTDPSTGEEVRTDEEAKAEAQAILDRLNNGEDFDTLMNEYSEDTGLANYPDGYTFTEGQMQTEFYDAAVDLEVGETSDLIKTVYGYHIIQRIPLDENAYTDYQDDITSAMGMTMETLIQQWMDEAEVETTDVYNEINYQNAKDYVADSVSAILNGTDEEADTADESTDESGDAAAAQ